MKKITTAYLLLIAILIAGVSYRLGYTAHPRPVYIKYQNIQHSLKYSMQNAGIYVSPEQWELLQKDLTRGK